MPVAPTLCGRLGIGQVVDVGEQLDVRAVGAAGGKVAIGEEPVFEVEKLALNLAISRGGFLVGPDDHHAVAAVDDHHVAALDFASGSHRDPATAGMPRLRARIAA